MTRSPDDARSPGGTPTKRNRQRGTRIFGALIAATAIGVASGAPAMAQEDSHQRGPDPTESSIEEPRGSFEVATTTVSGGEAPGFGGGTIHYPADSDQTFGAVAVSPGFISPQALIEWYGPMLASHGFVVVTFDTNLLFDFPDARADQLQAALDYVTEDSEVSGMVDADRTAVMGHSMGGGGTLKAAERNPDLEAAVSLEGWHLQKDFSGVQVPSFVISGENDMIAPADGHSIPFYESLASDIDKAYMELAGASHFAPMSENTTIAKYTISWMKLHVDNDQRYAQFLCPEPTDSAISDYRSNCPY